MNRVFVLIVSALILCSSAGYAKEKKEVVKETVKVYDTNIEEQVNTRITELQIQLEQQQQRLTQLNQATQQTQLTILGIQNRIAELQELLIKEEE